MKNQVGFFVKAAKVHGISSALIEALCATGERKVAISSIALSPTLYKELLKNNIVDGSSQGYGSIGFVNNSSIIVCDKLDDEPYVCWLFGCGVKPDKIRGYAGVSPEIVELVENWAEVINKGGSSVEMGILKSINPDFDSSIFVRLEITG